MSQPSVIFFKIKMEPAMRKTVKSYTVYIASFATEPDAGEIIEVTKQKGDGSHKDNTLGIVTHYNPQTRIATVVPYNAKG
jgi:hypothetical protein